MPSQMIAPLQEQIQDVRLKLNTYDSDFSFLKTGIDELKQSNTFKLGRVEFFRLAMATSVGAGAVWALVTWLRPAP